MRKMPSGIGSLSHSRAQGVRTAIAIAAVLVVLRFTPLTAGLAIFTIPESFAYDTLFETQAPSPPGDIVIVAIDDPSVTRLGRFPWSRREYARLLAAMPNAKAVAFDILLTEPDRNDSRGDALFAAAIKRHGRVVLGCFKTALVTTGEGPAYDLVARAYPGRPSRLLTPIQTANFVPPIAPFAESAAGIGYVDIEPDPDGVYRRVAPLRRGYDGRMYPHFAMEVARVASGQPSVEITARVADDDCIRPAPGRTARLGNGGTVIINYCGATGTLKRHSFADVIDGRVPPSEFDGRIVLVGATAPGLYDIRPAPYRSGNRMFLGVETNANVVNTLLHRDPILDQTRAWYWGVFAVLLAALIAWVVWSAREGLGVGMGVVLAAIVALPSFWFAFHALHAVISYGAILWSAVSVTALAGYSRLTRERKLIREQFDAYVSPAVLAELLRDPDVVRQGARREVSLLFSDIRGSTSLSESLAPETWLGQLNEYLTQMSTAVFEYDGYLDKFMGDGIMAVWNAFGNQTDHAERAVRCGLRMLQCLRALNRLWDEAPDRAPLRIGIGVHQGEAVVGNVGSAQRTQYTAIGDPVNTASRIESMTKEHHVAFIISEDTATKVAGLFELRELGEAEVHGRTEHIRIFEVLGEAQRVPEGSTTI